MDTAQVKKLAELARLEVDETELAVLAADMDTIIGFVDEIQQVALPDIGSTTPLSHNVFRDDEVSVLTPVYDLVEAAPSHQDGFVKVPKVIQ